jgi:hypothetical protein
VEPIRINRLVIDPTTDAEALPSNLQDSTLAEALQAICDFDVGELQAIEPPARFRSGLNNEMARLAWATKTRMAVCRRQPPVIN